MSFDPRYQESPNGALSPALRARIHAVKRAHGLSDQQLARLFGTSRALVSEIIREPTPKRIRSVWLPAIVAAVTKLEEAEAAWSDQPAAALEPPHAVSAATTVRGPGGQASDLPDPVAELVQLAARMGCAVTFAPIAD